MYTEYYGLTTRPFQLSPDPDFFFGARAHRRAISYLTYGLQQGEGFVVVTGEVGTGKTTLVAWLERQLADPRLSIVRLNAAHLGPRDLLFLVARALGLQPASQEAGALLAAIEDELRRRRDEGRRVLLVVDEVQNLPVEALEQLRLLSNLEHAGRPLLQIVLVGQPQFLETLERAALEQLRQRVVASVHLEPLEPEEVQAYVEHRLRRAGWTGDPAFDPEAFREIARVSGGIPRRINLLCSRLLLYGALEGKRRLTAEDVRTVAAELAAEPGSGFPEGGPVRETAGPIPPPPAGTPLAPGLAEAAFPPPAGDDPAFWRREVERLQRKLESVYDEVLRERHRHDEVRAEAERLREELHRLEVERLRVDAETARRLAELVAQLARGEKRRLLERVFGRRDDA